MEVNYFHIYHSIMGKFDYRYIYLMHKAGSTKHKIGIAKDPEIRLATIDKGVQGKVELVISRRVIYAGKVERYMHNFFAGSRFYFWKAGRASGRTEWFNLNPIERWFAKFLIEIFGLMPILLFVGSFLLLWFYFPEVDIN